MAFFKKSKIKEEESDAKKESVAAKKTVVVRKSGKDSRLILATIKSLLITEKASVMAEQNKYVFKVNSAANKIQVKDAIEGLYNVTVTKVNILTLPGKTRKRGLTKGYKPGYKKAIVSLKEGDKIEIAT